MKKNFIETVNKSAILFHIFLEVLFKQTVTTWAMTDVQITSSNQMSFQIASCVENIRKCP